LFDSPVSFPDGVEEYSIDAVFSIFAYGQLWAAKGHAVVLRRPWETLVFPQNVRRLERRETLQNK
jgi:hypothetical protein